MEIDRAMRNADNRIVASLALAFAALVFLIGIASNDVPSEIAMTESSFDIAQPMVMPAPERADAPSATSRRESRAALVAAPTKDAPWFADESARGTRPDGPR